VGGATVVVIDSVGEIYETLRRAAQDFSFARLNHVNGSVPAAPVVVLASYASPDWRAVSRIVPRSRTLIVAASLDRSDALRAIHSRAYGYIEATAEPAVLRRALQAVIAGELAYGRGVLADFVRMQLHSPLALRVLGLTARQREVVALIAKGSTDKEIAQALGISTATAEKHVTNVLRKLGVPNRAAAAAATVSLVSGV
jgi:DNA-binding NarL/FixJ family response regulator